MILPNHMLLTSEQQLEQGSMAPAFSLQSPAGNLVRLEDFPNLVDDTQEVAKAYGAVCTPDPFLFDANKRLVYHGRIDDALSPTATATTRDMADVIEAVLKGEKSTNEFLPSQGCSIKWRTK